MCIHKWLRGAEVFGVVFALAMAAVMPSFASSPYSWANYYAPKRVGVIVIDGDLSDWESIKGFTMDQEKYFFVGQGMSSKSWGGPKDLSATFKVVWDEKYIYVAVHVVDDKVNEPFGSLASGLDTGSWDDDGIELMLDNDGSNMSHYYIGDPMHHELHFVYSARHPLVFDNFWKYQAGAPQPMFTLPNGEKELLAFPNEVMAKHEITQAFPNPPTTALSLSSAQRMGTTSNCACPFRAPS